MARRPARFIQSGDQDILSLSLSIYTREHKYMLNLFII